MSNIVYLPGARRRRFVIGLRENLPELITAAVFVGLFAWLFEGPFFDGLFLAGVFAGIGAAQVRRAKLRDMERAEDRSYTSRHKS